MPKWTGLKSSKIRIDQSYVQTVKVSKVSIFNKSNYLFPTNPRIRWCLDLLPTLGFGRASKLLEQVAGRVFLENRCRTSFIAGFLLVVQGFLLVGSFQEMSTSGLTSLIMIQQHHLGSIYTSLNLFARLEHFWNGYIDMSSGPLPFVRSSVSSCAPQIWLYRAPNRKEQIGRLKGLLSLLATMYSYRNYSTNGSKVLSWPFSSSIKYTKITDVSKSSTAIPWQSPELGCQSGLVKAPWWRETDPSQS